ncbi:MAG: hypothetical protein AAFP68_22880 [Pseudomonadota bacterium]
MLALVEVAKPAVYYGRMFCGTLQYLAPEIHSHGTSKVQRGYDGPFDGSAADIWRLGFVLFVLL